MILTALITLLVSMLLLQLEVFGFNLSDPATLGNVVGWVLVAIGSYVLVKARWILAPLGELFKAYGRYRSDTSDGGSAISEKEKADLLDNHVMPIIGSLWDKLSDTKIIKRILGVPTE